jgi:hypothetical protein
MASTAGPDFTPFRHCYDWQGRSGIAGRFCPSDQAAPRPNNDIWSQRSLSAHRDLERS